MANKENAFALTGDSSAASASKPATRSRKPATGSGKLKLAPTKSTAAGRGKKAAAPPAQEEEEEEEDAEDELMAVGEGETVVQETQFDQGEETVEEEEEEEEVVPPKKGGKKAAAGGGKKAPAKKAAASSKAKGREVEAAEEFDAGGEDEFGEVKHSAREKKLAAQLEATKKALLDSQAAFKKLSELRSTRAEEAELRLREIADERQAAAVKTIESYKSESDALRTEVSSLQSTAYASPRSKSALLESRRVRELEEEKAALEGKVEELEREVEERERERGERERWWEGECERRVREVEREVGKEARELKQELDTVRTELSAEVSHSKSLQAKLKSHPTSSSLNTTSSSASLTSSGNSLQEEVERLTSHLNLNEDLTGFAVHAVKQEDVGVAYTCILNDAAGQTGGLNFKLTFHADSTVGYSPNVEPERDAELMARLPSEMQGYMRFPADLCAEWFKRLFNAVNKVRA